MKVFISWSGAASREIAVLLSTWFPKVLQGVEPFVSALDIDKGANWAHELNKELNSTDFGVICMTPANLASPWLNYEAGAIAKSVTSRVCPVLHGVKKSEVNPPISQLQMTDLDLGDMMLLMRSMNKSLSKPLPESTVDEAVSVWWPLLERGLGDVDIPDAGEAHGTEPEQPEASQHELLTEMLRQMRILGSRVDRIAGTRNTVTQADPEATFSQIEDAVVDVLAKHKLANIIDALTIKNDGVKIELSKNPSSREMNLLSAPMQLLAMHYGMPFRLQGPSVGFVTN